MKVIFRQAAKGSEQDGHGEVMLTVDLPDIPRVSDHVLFPSGFIYRIEMVLWCVDLLSVECWVILETREMP